MARVVIQLLLTISILSAELPFKQGVSAHDNGLGINGSSPFTHPLLAPFDTSITLETGFTNYYSAPLDIASKQLYTLSWGVLYQTTTIAFNASATSLTAFNMYQELIFQLGVAYRLRPQLGVGLTLSGERRGVDTLTQWRGATEIGVTWGAQNLSGAVLWKMREFHGKESILEHTLTLQIRAQENRLGAQALQLSWQSNIQKFGLNLAEIFPLTTWWELSLSLTTTPFFIHLGTLFHFKNLSVGIIMSNHPLLGWSQTIALRYSSR